MGLKTHETTSLTPLNHRISDCATEFNHLNIDDIDDSQMALRVFAGIGLRSNGRTGRSVLTGVDHILHPLNIQLADPQGQHGGENTNPIVVSYDKLMRFRSLATRSRSLAPDRTQQSQNDSNRLHGNGILLGSSMHRCGGFHKRHC